MKAKFFLALLACATSAMAEDTLAGDTLLTADQISWRENSRLTGDWNGLRIAQENAGVKTFAYFSGIVASNVSGGLESASSYSGDLFFGTELDLDKILDWENTTLVISGINRHGDSIDREVGGRYSVMQNVGGQTTFLYNFALEKTFLDDDLSIKLGRMSATDDFVGSTYYSYSLNNAVNGQIRAALFDGVMSSYPFAVWGGRGKYQINDELSLMVGVFNQSEDIFDRNDHGLDWRIDGEDGVSIFTQVNWNPTLDNRPAHFFAGMNQMVGYDIDTFNSSSTRDEFTRFYAHADYQIYAESRGSEEGLVLFSTLAYSPYEDVAIMPLQSSFGAHYTGLLKGRGHDRTVFFATYGQFSDDYAAEEVAAGRGLADYEMVLELGHRFQLTPSSYIQPDIQHIIQPGGTGEIENAWVIGVQFGATF